MDITQQDMIRRLFGRGGRNAPPPLPRAAVKNDSIDKMEYKMREADSPRFRRIAVDEAPQIAPNVPDPDPIDFTTSTPEEIKAWQEKAREAKAARDSAPPYDAWRDLTHDVFSSYHHLDEPTVRGVDEVDPAVSHHAKIAAKMVAEDAHSEARNLTRGKPTAAALATMAAVRSLKESLENELIEQARQSEEFEQQRQQANSATSQLESLRDQARDLKGQGQPIPADLKEAITKAVLDKRALQAQAAQTALATPVPMDMAGHEAVKRAVQDARQAAKDAGNVPSFGQGFGQGEPRYESPEQALTIADMWINNPILRAVSKLYGRLDMDMRFKRAKRVVGGADEIVDLKFGDDLRRILPTELAALADEDYEDDFYMRLLSNEVRVFDTVGQENAGKGPIVLVGDESSSMSGEPNVWLKAMALCLMNIARREQRDFAYVGFGSTGQCHHYLFPAKQDLDPQLIVDMASHFYGGGTSPGQGIAVAGKIMEEREFKKADIVLVGDGQASLNPDDYLLRDKLMGRGTRIWGIGIGGTYGYLSDFCEDVVEIHSFDLQDPSAATAHLATHIT